MTAAMVAAFYGAGPVAAQLDFTPATADEIHQAALQARAEIPEMARYFGWTNEVPVVSSGAVDASAEQVSIDEAAIARLVAPVNGYGVRNAVRMIVAHEVWHYIEIRRGKVSPALIVGDRRKVYECRADLMAARYLTRDESPYNSETGPEFNLARSISTQLWSPLGPYGAVRPTPDSSTNHPTPTQRQSAADFGALSVERDLMASESQDTAGIDQIIDYRSGETLDQWSERSCRRITQFRQAAVSMLLIDQEPKLEKRGDRTVFSFNVRNRGGLPIAVSMIVQATYYRRETDPPSATSWSFPVDFTIQPGGAYPVKGELEGFTGDHERVQFVHRFAPDALMVSAEVLRPKFTGATALLGRDLSSEDVALGAVLQRLANDAPYGFAHHRGPGGALYGNRLTIPSLLQIPGGRSTTIQLGNDGASSLRSFLYSGASDEEARKTYDDWVGRIRRIWPDAKVSATSDLVGSGRKTKIWITRFALVEISIFKGTGDYYINLEMFPNALGLVGE